MMRGSAVGTQWREDASGRFVVEYKPTRLLRAVGAVFALVGALLLAQGTLGAVTGQAPVLVQVEGASAHGTIAPSLILGAAFGAVGGYVLTWGRRVEIDRPASNLIEMRLLLGRQLSEHHPLPDFEAVEITLARPGTNLNTDPNSARRYVQVAMNGKRGEVVLACFTRGNREKAQLLATAASEYARLKLVERLG
jgi:hypothetical protein